MVHGDLKAANVVVSRQGVAMITDFGNSQLKALALTLKFTNTNTNNFSLRWAAPELLLAEAKPQLTEKTDVYAYGMTALETLTGKVPFEGLNEHQVMRSVAFQQRTPDRATFDLGDRLWELLCDCWTWDESIRPGIAVVERRLNALLPQTPLAQHPHLSTAPTAISSPALPPPPKPMLPSRVIDIIFDIDLELTTKTTIQNFRMGGHVCIIYLRALAFFIAKPFILFLLYAQNPRPCTALTSTSSAHQRSPPSRTGPKLPPEVINIIFDVYLESKTTIRGFFTRRREYVAAVLGRSCCDPAHAPKGVVYGAETRIITVDVRSGCLPKGADLSVYPNLESVSPGCHNASTCDQHANIFALLPVNDVITLPRFLTQLEVLDAHRPIIQIIQPVASVCPEPAELMFNKPECWWWGRDGQDAEHDYMCNHDYRNVGAFTASLYDRDLYSQVYDNPEQHETVDSLCALKQLKIVRMGVYLPHTQAAVPHQIEHKGHHPHLIEPTLRELWADPCPRYERELMGRIEDTEQQVAAVLGSKLESVCTVSFLSFLNDRRIRPSHWEVQREVKSASGKKWGVVAKISPGPWYPPGARLRVRSKLLESRKFAGLSVEFDNFMGD